ncbi:GNAT family N-acetyltransferase [Corynebacterium tapiri]|uniref:GNAT family N-acetyltransferase n=1 Tax=Corynebacterium tapiri TaxID=1448266 RepID=A0A5C4U6A8_9CORY|nr:GNAT family protein [Corynebacterium tapiri]TNM00432.1 GNAT family N-acetyltransferase [Corynebacterium tapiri]
MLNSWAKPYRNREPSSARPHPVHPGWPEVTPCVTLLSGEELRLRPVVSSDGAAWSRMRRADEAWLKPVEPTQHTTWHEAHSTVAWRSLFRAFKEQAQRGTLVPMVIEIDGEFAGQVTIGNIQHGTISDAWIGYWVHSAHMGKGAATAACALGVDHAFRRIGLHRLTATYLPSNPASGAVLLKNGFREEGFLVGNLHIDGQWRDHHVVALLNDEFPQSCVARLVRAGKIAAWR